MANTAAWLSLPDIFFLKTVVPLYMIMATTFVGVWPILRYIWTEIIQLPSPFPFVCHINLFFFAVPALIVGIWFKFPSSWRKNQAFRRRLFYLLLAQLYVNALMAVKYGIFTVAFVYSPLEYQWLLIPLLILSKEFGQRILNKICSKMIETSDEKDDSQTLVNAYLSKTFYIAAY